MNDVGIVTDFSSLLGFDFGALMYMLPSLFPWSVFRSAPSDEKVNDDDEGPSDCGCSAAAGTELNRRDHEERDLRRLGFLKDVRVLFVREFAIDRSGVVGFLRFSLEFPLLRF